jgi:hypothetical protein
MLSKGFEIVSKTDMPMAGIATTNIFVRILRVRMYHL